MVPRYLFRSLGLALALVSSLPAAALAGQLARRSRPAPPPPAPERAPAVACGATTVTQSSSQTIVDQNTVECVDQNTGAHADNSFWRALDLRELGVLGPFDVCEVSVGIEVATSSGGTGQSLTVNL
jgi:hypothetical protein